MFIKLLLLFVVASATFALEISKEPVFQALYKEEKNSDKLLLMLYTAKSCPQCSYMKKKVFKEKNVQIFLDEHFVILEKDVQKDELPEGFEYFGIPTMFFIDKNGVTNGKFIGSARAEPFLKELQKVVQERKTK